MLINTEQYHDFKRLTIEESSLKSMYRVLSLIRFFPFAYRKNPFCFTAYAIDDTYILLAKEYDGTVNSSIEVKSFYRKGLKATLYWDVTDSPKTIEVKRKVFSYDLILIKDIPFTGVNVDPVKIQA